MARLKINVVYTYTGVLSNTFLRFFIGPKFDIWLREHYTPIFISCTYTSLYRTVRLSLFIKKYLIITDLIYFNFT